MLFGTSVAAGLSRQHTDIVISLNIEGELIKKPGVI